jgi:hypothetical protein
MIIQRRLRIEARDPRKRSRSRAPVRPGPTRMLTAMFSLDVDVQLAGFSMSHNIEHYYLFHARPSYYHLSSYTTAPEQNSGLPVRRTDFRSSYHGYACQSRLVGTPISQSWSDAKGDSTMQRPAPELCGAVKDFDERVPTLPGGTIVIVQRQLEEPMSPMLLTARIQASGWSSYPRLLGSAIGHRENLRF